MTTTHILRPLALLACLTCAMQLLGCARDDAAAIAPLAVVEPVAADLGVAIVAQDGDWGTIKGKITWGGNVPKEAKIDLKGNDAAACLKANKGEPPPDESYVVNPKNKGMKNVFVWLVDAKLKAPPINPKLKNVKLAPVEIDQPACHFIPHAIALREGQKLIVKNSSPFPHSFQWLGAEEKNQGNIIIPPGGQIPIDLIASRSPIPIKCTIHPWMQGWVRVFSHPYFAVTDADGNFEIKDAPAGEFRLMVWQARGGWKGQAKGRQGDPVTIKGGTATDLGNIVYPEPPAD